MDIKHIAEKNKELVSLWKKTMEGVLLRSKAGWVVEGEKISKYFCNLEKRHYVSKQMIKLIDAKGEEIWINKVEHKISQFADDTQLITMDRKYHLKNQWMQLINFEKYLACF